MKLVGCVIPCYLGNSTTIDVIKKTLKLVSFVVLVDDNCPNQTGKKVLGSIKNKKLVVIKNDINRGVGYSAKRGINYLLSIDCDIIIKIDADGQMNPELIPSIIEPIIKGESDAVKGNRFNSIEDIMDMPKLRIIGNLGLSFLNKLSTGYWELFDPTNGFIAFNSNTLKRIRLHKLDDRYFFESDLLFQCSLANIYFKQLPMKSIYKDELSSLKPIKEISRFSILHLRNFTKRIIYQYFILDFNAGTLEIIGFILGICLSSFYYVYIKFFGLEEGTSASPSQANFLAISIIISFQLLLSFIFFDTTQKPLMRRIKD